MVVIERGMVFLFIHHLPEGTEGPPTLWLLWTRLLWTLGCSCPTSLCICIFGVSSRLYTCWSQVGSICNFRRSLHTAVSYTHLRAHETVY